MPNRKEVAEKLRENSTVHTTDEVYVALLSCIGIKYDYANLLSRLADLIDPTCHDFGGEEGTNGESYDFACSACGWCGDVTKPNYCPHCGARVVHDVV